MHIPASLRRLHSWNQHIKATQLERFFPLKSELPVALGIQKVSTAPTAPWSNNAEPWHGFQLLPEGSQISQLDTSQTSESQSFHWFCRTLYCLTLLCQLKTCSVCQIIELPQAISYQFSESSELLGAWLHSKEDWPSELLQSLPQTCHRIDSSFIINFPFPFCPILSCAHLPQPCQPCSSPVCSLEMQSQRHQHRSPSAGPCQIFEAASHRTFACWICVRSNNCQKSAPRRFQKDPLRKDLLGACRASSEPAISGVQISIPCQEKHILNSHR